MFQGKHIIAVGLGYGDEAKGATVDWLGARVPDAAAVVRWSGGAQAAHNVIHGAVHHTFRQFGSATLLDLRTFLKAPMLVDPLMLGVEAEQLAKLGVIDPLGLITADPAALLTTPIHRAMNRAREILRGANRHGSTGMGIGETVAYDLAVRQGAAAGDLVGNFRAPGAVMAGVDAPRVGMLRDRARLVQALDALAFFAAPLVAQVADEDVEMPEVGELADALVEIGAHLNIPADFDAELGVALAAGTVIFEGAQGVLLDEYAGFHPHTTWARVTPGALRAELIAAGHEVFTLGITRAYMTRHGDGPMPSEAALDLPELHNTDGRYMGGMRAGHLDLPALRYAAAACGGLDGIAVTHLDALDGGQVRAVDRWELADGRVLENPAELVVDAGLAVAAGELPPGVLWDGFAGEITGPAAADARGLFAGGKIGEEMTPDLALQLIEAATGAKVRIVANGPTRNHRKPL